MKQQNFLGIYLSKNTATALCLGGEGQDKTVLGCFSVAVEEHQEQKPQRLAQLIAAGCAQRTLEFSEVAVALDCAMFMQHNVRSEFSEPRQIAATVRFDTEEALAMDVSDIAIAFRPLSSDQSGSDLIVFTAQKKQLGDIIPSLQGSNIDPVTVEPDVDCLAGFILHNMLSPQDSKSFFCLLSSHSGYFFAFSKSQQLLAMRTFLLGAPQNRTDLLAREIKMTAALIGTDEPVNCIKVFDSAGSVDCRILSEKLGADVAALDLAAAAHTTPETLADCANLIDFAIASGAALAVSQKTRSTNFRNDFMPYQGGKIRLQKAIKFLSVSVVVLMVVLGIYLQMQLLQKNRYRSQLRKKFEKEYSAVMFGKAPAPKSEPLKKLEGELRHIRDAKSGQLSITGQESASAKLTLVFEAFNNCAAQTKLNIDSITIAAKTISIVGDTSSRENTLKVFETIRANRLDILQQRLDSKAGRDSFSISVVPKQQ